MQRGENHKAYAGPRRDPGLSALLPQPPAVCLRWCQLQKPLLQDYGGRLVFGKEVHRGQARLSGHFRWLLLIQEVCGRWKCHLLHHVNKNLVYVENKLVTCDYHLGSQSKWTVTIISGLFKATFKGHDSLTQHCLTNATPVDAYSLNTVPVLESTGQIN